MWVFNQYMHIMWMVQKNKKKILMNTVTINVIWTIVTKSLLLEEHIYEYGTSISM